MRIIFLFIGFIVVAGCTASNRDMSYSTQGKSFYSELKNPAVTPSEEWSSYAADVKVSFADDNTRYPKERVPQIASDNWTKDVLHDTRYKTWPAGDCYQIYPGPRTSIRFEKLIEGIQAFEKIRILREQFIKEGNSEQLKELDEVLSNFTMTNLETIPAVDMVIKGKEFINRF